MTTAFATAFAENWITSWNAHNLTEILNHYSDDIEITTPMIKMALGHDYVILKGKVAVADYWQKALDKIPDLHFKYFTVLIKKHYFHCFFIHY